jgi:hypothetical protein
MCAKTTLATNKTVQAGQTPANFNLRLRKKTSKGGRLRQAGRLALSEHHVRCDQRQRLLRVLPEKDQNYVSLS